MKIKFQAVAIAATSIATVILFATVNAPLARAQTATPSPALLVLNKSENSLAILDPATQKVLGVVHLHDLWTLELM